MVKVIETSEDHEIDYRDADVPNKGLDKVMTESYISIVHKSERSQVYITFEDLYNMFILKRGQEMRLSNNYEVVTYGFPYTTIHCNNSIKLRLNMQDTNIMKQMFLDKGSK